MKNADARRFCKFGHFGSSQVGCFGSSSLLQSDARKFCKTARPFWLKPGWLFWLKLATPIALATCIHKSCMDDFRYIVFWDRILFMLFLEIMIFARFVCFCMRGFKCLLGIRLFFSGSSTFSLVAFFCVCGWSAIFLLLRNGHFTIAFEN